MDTKTHKYDDVTLFYLKNKNVLTSSKPFLVYKSLRTLHYNPFTVHVGLANKTRVPNHPRVSQPKLHVSFPIINITHLLCCFLVASLPTRPLSADSAHPP